MRTDDAMVSRKHARIVWDGNYWVEDLDSANGVFVGSERVKRAPFRPGDIVTCGSLVMRMLPETGPLPARAQTPEPAHTPVPVYVDVFDSGFGHDSGYGHGI